VLTRLRDPITVFAGSVLVLAVVLVVITWWRDSGPDSIRYPVTWRVAQATNADITDVTLDVHASRCNDGGSIANQLSSTDIKYGADTITITLTAQITEGVHTCPSLVGDQVTIHLKEPIGDRKLVDGNSTPTPT
jgi:hypothetical protein